MINSIEKKKLQWVLVANGNSAKIIKIKAHKFNSNDNINLIHQDSKRSTHDLGTDKAGRNFNSSSSSSHAIDNKSDLHTKAKVDFAEEIAHLLNQESINAEGFDELFIVSSPELLGEIRGKLKKNCLDKLKNELNKDLTHESELKILAQLDIHATANN